MAFRISVYFSRGKKEFLRTLNNGIPTTTAKATKANLSIGYKGNTSAQLSGYASGGINPRS